MTRKRRSFTANRSDEIMTYKGIVFRPLEPEVRCIDIDDIAHALANSCRFTGHVRQFYSVAQHSVHVSRLLQDIFSFEPDLWQTGLLHDASEAYLSDIARPVKRTPEFSDVYDAVENRLMGAVAERFSIRWPMPDEVRWADDVLLRAEQRDLMPGTYPVDEANRFWPDNMELWLPEEAEASFLERYNELFT